MNISEVPIPSNLPAWAVIAFLIGLAVVGGIRLFITNYFAQQKEEFDAKLTREREAFDIQIQAKKNQLEIDFEVRKRALESDRDADALIGSAFANMTAFAETTRNFGQIIIDEQARSARERSNLGATMLDTSSQVAAIRATLNEVHEMLSDFIAQYNAAEVTPNDIARVARDVQEIHNSITDIKRVVVDGTDRHESERQRAETASKDGATPDDTGAV